MAKRDTSAATEAAAAAHAGRSCIHLGEGRRLPPAQPAQRADSVWVHKSAECVGGAHRTEERRRPKRLQQHTVGEAADASRGCVEREPIPRGNLEGSHDSHVKVGPRALKAHDPRQGVGHLIVREHYFELTGQAHVRRRLPRLRCERHEPLGIPRGQQHMAADDQHGGDEDHGGDGPQERGEAGRPAGVAALQLAVEVV